MKTVALVAIGCAACALACATVQLPPEHVASSEAAIRSAAELGAADVPQASFFLRLAEEEMNHAKALADEGDARRAELYLGRSTADAELALALVREVRARADADRVQADVTALERSTR